jgi:hypothetical protein
MQPVDDQFARRLRLLTAVIVLKLTERQEHNEQQNRRLDSEEYKKALAESYPELVRLYEQLTTDEWEEALKQLTMAESMAYGILWAMDHIGKDL